MLIKWEVMIGIQPSADILELKNDDGRCMRLKGDHVSVIIQSGFKCMRGNASVKRDILPEPHEISSRVRKQNVHSSQVSLSSLRVRRNRGGGGGEKGGEQVKRWSCEIEGEGVLQH